MWKVILVVLLASLVAQSGVAVAADEGPSNDASTAATVTFDFDTGTPALLPGANTPLMQTAGGVTASFSSPVTPVTQGFSVQDDSTAHLKMTPLFSGNYLYPNAINKAPLDILFDRMQSAITLTFATSDPAGVQPTTLQLAAYVDSVTNPSVGTKTAAGDFLGGSWPMGTMSFSSTVPFNLVRISIVPSPGGALSSFVDNVIVQPTATYTVTTTANPVQGGTTSGDGSYTAGTNVTVVAARNPNYAFVNWTENGLPVSTLESYTFSITADRTLVANFVLVDRKTYLPVVFRNP